MESGWLLADGEAVASAQSARSPLQWRRAVRAARRGEVAAVLRAPAVVLGPLDVIRVQGERAAGVRCVGRRPVCLVRPGTVVVVGPGDAERCGLHQGSTLELRWTP